MSADDVPPASVVEVHGVVGGGDGLGAFFGSVEADGLGDSVGIVFAFQWRLVETAVMSFLQRVFHWIIAAF